LLDHLEANIDLQMDNWMQQAGRANDSAADMAAGASAAAAQDPAGAFQEAAADLIQMTGAGGNTCKIFSLCSLNVSRVPTSSKQSSWWQHAQ